MSLSESATMLGGSDPAFDNGSFIGDGQQPLRRPSFNENIRNPLRQRFQQGKSFLQQQGNNLMRSGNQLQMRAPGFLLKYRQLMIITVLGIILYVLCIAKVKKNPQIPIVVGLATTLLMLYFIKRYADQVSMEKVATAGWVFVTGLVASIIAMSVWIESNK